MISFSLSSSKYNVLAVWATALLAMVVFVNGGAILGEQREGLSSQSRGVIIENSSGRKVDMFWVNTFVTPEQFVAQFIDDGEMIGLAYGADKAISSYVSHVFELRELPSKKTKRCVYANCRIVRFKVSKNMDQKYILEKDFTITSKDDHQKPFSETSEMFGKCQEKVDKMTKDPLEAIDLITECMEKEVYGKLNFEHDERSFHSKVHRNMAAELVPFTCGDVNKTESFEIKNTTWVYEEEEYDIEETHTLKTLHKLPTSEIFSVESFVNNATCDALKRKRKKEGYKEGVLAVTAMEESEDGHLIHALFYKIYAILMEHFPNWAELDFEEDWLFRYIKDPEGFKQPSHLCTTQEEVDEAVLTMKAGGAKKCHIPGGVPEAVPTRHVIVEKGVTEEDLEKKRQIAQMFLYCDEPEHQLGALHFPYAAVHINPKIGKLVVAVHRQEDDMDNDFDGYVNEYHMCPNHEVYVHTVYDHDPLDTKGAHHDEEGGEL